jgi:UDP-GlcNAc:undecaprenyl-phosphate GlcNAc-1-phosphate transferase
MEFSNELIDIVIPAWVIVVSGFLISMFITLKAIPPIINLARITGLNEKPNTRSSHKNSTPLFGGVAVFAGFTTTTVVLAGTGFSYELKYIIASLIILFFIGLKDDIFLIDPKKKLLGQIIASLIIIVLGDIRISSFLVFSV